MSDIPPFSFSEPVQLLLSAVRIELQIPAEELTAEGTIRCLQRQGHALIAGRLQRIFEDMERVSSMRPEGAGDDFNSSLQSIDAAYVPVYTEVRRLTEELLRGNS